LSLVLSLLDFKFVTANSLIGLPGSQENSQIGLFEDEAGIRELKELRDMFFTAFGAERDRLKLKFVQAQNRMFQRLISEGLKSHAELTTKLSIWDPFSHTSSWFDPEWMFGITDGFDIVIANPPYVQFQKLDINFREVLRKSSHYESQSDLWYFFVYKVYQLLQVGGLLTFIVSNYFLQAGHAETLRKFITNNFKARSITNFTDNYVFENVGVHSLIMLLEKVETIDYDMQYYECDDLSTLRLKNGRTFNINKSALGETWLLASDNDSIFINKLVSQGVKLGSFSKISNGIKSGEDSICILNKNADTGGFAEAQLLKNYLKNSDIHRYYIDDSSKSIIYSCSSTILEDYPIFKTIFPNIKGYSKKNGLKEARLMTSGNYIGHVKIYQSNKQLIVTPYRTNNIGFALNMGCLSGTDTYIILNKSDRINEFVLLALLNSKLIRWFYERTGKKER